MENRIIYFEEIKKENTAQTFKTALQRGNELGIKTFVVASTSGWTGVQAMKAFEGMNLIVVSHCYGSREPDKWLFADENLKLLKDKGNSHCNCSSCLRWYKSCHESDEYY